jgi:hypothetical protein
MYRRCGTRNGGVELGFFFFFFFFFFFCLWIFLGNWCYFCSTNVMMNILFWHIWGQYFDVGRFLHGLRLYSFSDKDLLKLFVRIWDNRTGDCEKPFMRLLPDLISGWVDEFHKWFFTITLKFGQIIGENLYYSFSKS